jgi:Sensors of blue-light using FAD
MTHVESAATIEKAIHSAPVFRLIYRSHSKIPAERFEAELGNILRAARARNSERGITGALLVYDDWFAQTLEGEETAVRGLFDKIATDPRHATVELREEGMAPTRVFSRWAMAKVAEHGDPDIQLAATGTGITEAAARSATPDQERILRLMRDATRGYGRGS